jgi:hypothetical protein
MFAKIPREQQFQLARPQALSQINAPLLRAW